MSAGEPIPPADDRDAESPLQVIGQLAGGIAHDFNNLLGVIINYAAFAPSSVPPRLAGAADIEEIRARRRARRRADPAADDPSRAARAASNTSST